MKVAFHFSADHPSLGTDYGLPITTAFFRRLISSVWSLSCGCSDVFSGDLALHKHAIWIERNSHLRYASDQDVVDSIFTELTGANTRLWIRLLPEMTHQFYTNNIHVFCLSSIETSETALLHQSLEGLPYYLGAAELDYILPLQRALYQSSLLPYLRIYPPLAAKILYEAADDILDCQDVALEEALRNAGFGVVNYEQFSS